MEQLSPCTTTTEPVCLEPVPHSKRSDHKEKPQRHHKEQPHLLQLEKAREQQQRPSETKKTKNLKVSGYGADREQILGWPQSSFEFFWKMAR